VVSMDGSKANFFIITFKFRANIISTTMDTNITNSILTVGPQLWWQTGSIRLLPSVIR
jgi:hypothetical protein